MFKVVPKDNWNSRAGWEEGRTTELYGLPMESLLALELGKEIVVLFLAFVALLGCIFPKAHCDVMQ